LWEIDDVDLSCPELSVKARALSRFERGIVHQVVDDVKTPAAPSQALKHDRDLSDILPEG
jgi:hypothetical protein